jgi:hypothetical protein
MRLDRYCTTQTTHQLHSTKKTLNACQTKISAESDHAAPQNCFDRPPSSSTSKKHFQSVPVSVEQPQTTSTSLLVDFIQLHGVHHSATAI